MDDGRRVAPRKSGVMPPQSRARVDLREVRTDGQFSARARLYRQNRDSLGDRALPFRVEIPYDWIREATGVVFEGQGRPDLPE